MWCIWCVLVCVCATKHKSKCKTLVRIHTDCVIVRFTECLTSPFYSNGMCESFISYYYIIFILYISTVFIKECLLRTRIKLSSVVIWFVFFRAEQQPLWERHVRGSQQDLSERWIHELHGWDHFTLLYFIIYIYLQLLHFTYRSPGTWPPPALALNITAWTLKVYTCETLSLKLIFF